MGRFLLGQLVTEDRDFAAFVSATGFDFRQHLNETVFAFLDGDRGWLIAARGSFPAARIVAALKAAGATTRLHEGAEIVEGSTGSAFAFLDNSIALTGDPDAVRAAITRHRSAAAVPAGRAARAAKAAANRQAWFIADPAAVLSAGMPAAFAGGLYETVTAISGGARLSETVELVTELAARSESDAGALATVMRAFASLGGMGMGEGAAFAKTLSRLQVSQSGNGVKLSASMPEEDFEALVRESMPLVSTAKGR